MPNLIERAISTAAYGAAQTARVGWYTAQYISTRHAAGPITAPGEVPRPYRAARPGAGVVQKAFFDLLAREGRDIAAGRYRLPRSHRQLPNPFHLLAQAGEYRREVGRISRRVFDKGGAMEVRTRKEIGYPPYYLQNFHFQSDGWLSAESARIYDTQVETLFTGAADTMRRRALPMLLDEIDRIDGQGRRPLVADIACGTGRLLADLLDNRRGIDAIALDLSGAYLDQAQRHVGRERARFIKANAESLPFEDNSVDILYSVYLFHELPPKVRPVVAEEFARVLKPGGLYVHVDSAQYGDTGMDILLEGFPRAVHEPYYDHYCREDLPRLFGNEGFVEEDEEIAFLSKVSSFRCPAA